MNGFQKFSGFVTVLMGLYALAKCSYEMGAADQKREDARTWQQRVAVSEKANEKAPSVLAR